jgi:membrane fusion protein (multidrug efflux system)
MSRRNLTVVRTLAAVLASTAVGVALFPLHPRSFAGAATPLTSTPRAGGARILVEAVVARAVVTRDEVSLSGEVQPSHTATVASEVANRVLSRPVSQGDGVARGALLLTLDTDAARVGLRQAVDARAQTVAARRLAETDYARAAVETAAAREQARAQVGQALAGSRAAHAEYARALAGERKARAFTRPQELDAAETALSQARTDEDLARIEYNRYAGLVREGAASQQSLDQRRAALDGAVDRRRAAEQALSLAQEGARQEDRDDAAAQVEAAAAQRDAADRQIDVARAGLAIAGTRNVRLAVLRRQIESLRAQEAQAADAVRQARIALDRRSIRAPFAGRVLATLADTGDMTVAGAPVIRLGRIDPVKVAFTVPEAVRPALRLGQAVTIRCNALPGTPFAGRITALGFQADPRSRAFPIEVTVRNPREALLPGMVARVRLPAGDARTRVVVPASAVTADGGSPCVYVLLDGKAFRRSVTLGEPHGDDVEIRAGVASGDRLAATPQRLSDGVSVRDAGERP